MSHSKRAPAFMPQLQRLVLVLLIGATLVVLTAMGLRP